MPSNLKCCVPDCISRSAKQNLAFHKIPTNKLLAEKWLQTIANAKLKVSKSSRICGLHFKRHQYSNLRKNILKKGVVPVLFLPATTANAVLNLEQRPNNSIELEEISPKLSENSPEPTSVSNKSYDFTKTCRICLLEQPELQNIESDFIQKLFQSSDILKFSANDTFPKQICSVCLGELKVVYHFSLKCGKSSDVFRKFADKFTNSEQITNSSVDKLGLSKTVQISYVPPADEMRNIDNKDRTFNYKLIAVDGILRPELSSLVTLAQLKETAIDQKPILSRTIQAFEFLCSETQKPIACSVENEKTLSLGNNSTDPRISTANKCTLDTTNVSENMNSLENKSVKEVRANSSYKRVVRSCKSDLPGKNQALVCEVPMEKTKIPQKQAATACVSAISEQEADLTEERVTHRSRSTKRRSRRYRSRSRNYRSRSRSHRSRSRHYRSRSRSYRSRSRSVRSRSRSFIRPKRFSTRKKVASGNGVYWYDKKPDDPATNQMNSDVSEAVENRNEGLEMVNTAGGYELPRFDDKSKSVGSELHGNAAGKSTTSDTAAKSTGLAEQTGDSVERSAGLAVTEVTVERSADTAEKTAGLVERTAGLAITDVTVERTADTAEKTAGSVERIASSVERISVSAERTAGSAERTAGSAERTAGSVERTAISAERTAGSVERIANSAEKIADSTERTTVPAERTTDAAETTAQSDMNSHSDMDKPEIKQTNTTILQCQPIKPNIGEETTKSVVNVQTRRRGRPRKRTGLPTDKLETSSLDKLHTTATQASNIGNHVPSNIENYKLIPNNEKNNTKNSIPANSNLKSGNRVTRRSIKNTTAKLNTKSGTAVTNITENNNTTLTENQNRVPESKTDNIISKTAQQHATENVPSKDCQHNSEKITKETKTPIKSVDNEIIYMKLRHKNVKFSVSPRKSGKLLHFGVNIKHLHLSKQEFNRLLNVKLELTRLKVQYNKESNHNNITKISINKRIHKKKVRVFKTTSESSRELRSSKINKETSAVTNCNIDNIKLAKGSILQNLQEAHLNVDKDKNINVTHDVQGSELNSIKSVQKDEDSSYEDVKPKQDTNLEISDTVVAKMEDISVANRAFKDETGLDSNGTDVETSEIELDNIFAQISANTNDKNAAEYEPCENIKAEVDNKGSPDTTTKYTYGKSDLPNNKLETQCLLKSTTDYTNCSQDSKPELDSQSPIIEHSYCSLENIPQDEQHALNCKTECLPNINEQDTLANSVIELDPLENTPVNNATDNCNTNTEGKGHLIEQLHEFVVFPDQNSSSADENGVRTELPDAPTEEYMPTNYYQALDDANDSLTDAQIINSDAMLSNVQKLSPELQLGVPTVYDNDPNKSFEISIDNILSTEYNSVCDGRLVGSGIVLEDVAANEEVLPTEAADTVPVLYQHVAEQSPNCNGMFYNQGSGMIVASLPAEETSSEDEYLSNTWVPVVQSVTDASSILFDNMIVEHGPSTSNASVAVATSNAIGNVDEQNLASWFECNVCKLLFRTRGQLNTHTVIAEHYTKRFCKHCKLSLDIPEFERHVQQHENESYCCEICGEMLYEASKIVRHTRTHQRHKCQLCSMEFESKFRLSEHLVVHTGGRRDQCRHCNRKFARPSALITHLAARICLKDKGKFVCTVCKTIFYSKKKALRHVPLHQRYECTLCNRTFSTVQYCRKHVRLVHEIK